MSNDQQKYSEQVRKDAKAAADLCRTSGWVQGKTGSPDVGMCAIGLCWFATGDGEDQSEGHCTRDFNLWNALRKELPVGASVSKWNDTPGRTKEEVLEVFDRIAQGK